MRRPKPRRAGRQLRLREMGGIVVLKKHPDEFDTSDLNLYVTKVEDANGQQTLTLLKEIYCLRSLGRTQFGQDMIRESQIDLALTELVFHSDEKIAKVASEVLLLWQKGCKTTVNNLREVPIGPVTGATTMRAKSNF